MSKMKEFKQRLNNNRGKSITGEKSNSIIDIKIKEKLIAKVDRNTIRVNENDLSEYVKDIMTMRKNLSKGEIIDLNSMCDCMYNIKFLGVKSIGEEKIAFMEVC